MFHLIKKTKQNYSSKIEGCTHTHVREEPFRCVAIAGLDAEAPAVARSGAGLIYIMSRAVEVNAIQLGSESAYPRSKTAVAVHLLRDGQHHLPTGVTARGTRRIFSNCFHIGRVWHGHRHVANDLLVHGDRLHNAQRVSACDDHRISGKYRRLLLAVASSREKERKKQFTRDATQGERQERRENFHENFLFR